MSILSNYLAIYFIHPSILSIHPSSLCYPSCLFIHLSNLLENLPNLTDKKCLHILSILSELIYAYINFYIVLITAHIVIRKESIKLYDRHFHFTSLSSKTFLCINNMQKIFFSSSLPNVLQFYSSFPLQKKNLLILVTV